MPIEGKYLGPVADQFSIEDVGSTLLEHLAKGLYEPQEVIREYVQNAVDAHRLWKSDTGFDPDGPIQIEVRGEQLSIYDYGIGMEMADIRKVKSIAVSRKRDADVALTGHKGVGIWAGLSYFEKLTLFTTKKGSRREYRLTIQFKKIVDAISDERNIGEVLNPNYSIVEYEAEEDDHYTTVTLESPTRSADWFTESEKVADAIGRICPCDIDPNFVFRDELMAWYERHKVDLFPMMVDGAPVYRSFSSAVEQFRPGTITIDDVPVAEYWYAVSKKHQLPATSGQIVGLRLVQNGFVIGGANPRSESTLPGYKRLGVTNSNYLNWHIGEIHITSDTLRPNLQRDQLEESEDTRQFTQRLRDFYERVEEEDRALSDKRNTLSKYKKHEQKLDSLINQQALVVLSAGDRAQLESIRTELTGDENSAHSRSNGKKSSHLKDSEVKRLRAKLLKDISKMLTGTDTVVPDTQQRSNDGRRSDSQIGVAPVLINEGASPAQATVHPAALGGLPTSNTVVQGSSSISSMSASEFTERHEQVAPGQHSNVPAPEWLVADEGDEAEPAASTDIHDVPTDIFFGLLEEILEEVAPGNENLRLAIMSKLRKRVEAVMSDD